MATEATPTIPIGTRAARRAARLANGGEIEVIGNPDIVGGSGASNRAVVNPNAAVIVEGQTSGVSPEAFVRFREVHKKYQTGGANGVVVTALNGLTFDINKGELIVIVGPSGAGKTTLLNLLGGMDSPTSGDIWFGNQDIARFTEKQLTEYRRHDIGFVFQFYNLMPNLTALENVELATEICRNPHSPSQVLNDVGLAGRGGSFPAQLSGGEQQRVSIARAVAKNPRIILCDEPTGALDYETGKKILALLRDICIKFGTTVVIVTHNSALKAMADTVITIKNGRAEKIIRNPAPTPIEEIEW